MPVTPFRPPSGSVLFDGEVVQTFTSPDGWALVGLTPYTGQRQTGQRQVGYNSTPCPGGTTYRAPNPYFSPENGYTGYWAYYEGCWSGYWFPGATAVNSAWGSWYAPPQPVGPIYEPVYSYFLKYQANAIAANGSEVSGFIGEYERLYGSIAERDAAFNRHTTKGIGLLVCNPDTQIRCGPSLKTSTTTCCLDCATLSAQLGGIAAALQGAAAFTAAKADELAAQAAENRRKAKELEGQ